MALTVLFLHHTNGPLSQINRRSLRGLQERIRVVQLPRCRAFFGRLGAGYWESYDRLVAQRYSEIEQKLNEASASTTSPHAPSSPTYSYYNQSSSSNGGSSYHSQSPTMTLSPPAPPPPVFAMTSKFGVKLYQNRALAKEVDRLVKDAGRSLEERVGEAYTIFLNSFQVKSGAM